MGVPDVDFEGPEFSDCETAAHLRDCGFCRSVIRQLAAEEAAAVAKRVQQIRADNKQLWRLGR